ncbi:BTB/POZ-like protein [Neofusicoccum parvum]|uniref:BTB/POZ-like protein n=2 Tax=Neofusicoccum parvum TaxID=310453 RepID=A0ACB5S4Y9_9PEZI|nr:putative btb poz-like protein [Neofusicoccum parvum UCRNP2]GME27827.1 BTB/POZ-like protein [Neofusicoccum parvum]GME61024.1 BTB/POZ-like protein [Neofusicoccum parvum]
MAARSPSPKGEKPLHELLSHALVDIYVGTENTHWILHEKLLCARSRFFQRIFYSKSSKSSSYGLPEEEDGPFSAFVSWLYSGHVPPPKEEKDLTTLFDMYLMGEKWQASGLVRDVLKEVREWYARTDTYPGLRRVQYVYANTDEDSEMRRLMVNSVARMMALNETIPPHWDKALRKNGQLAVDLIKSIQSWRIDPTKVPDMRRAVEEKVPQIVDNLADKPVEPKGGDDAQKLAEGLVNGLKDAGGKKEDVDKKPEEVKKELDDNLPNGVGLPNGLPAEDID